MKKEEIIVIGAGASGMMAALTAAKEGADVLLLEKLEKPGKKLLATGNGKCNFTNTYQDRSCYRGNDLTFIENALRCFSYQDTLEFFHDMGILSMEKNGYVYPNSEQAGAIVDAFVRCLNEHRVRLQTKEVVKSLKCEKDIMNETCSKNSFIQRTGLDAGPNEKKVEAAFWRVETDRGSYLAKKVILSLGGLASPVHGTTGDGYAMAAKLGMELLKPLPALTALVLSEPYVKEWTGIRVKGAISLFNQSGKLLAHERGELQMVDYGISGIPVFQVSRYAARELDKGGMPYLILDILPDHSQEELEKELTDLQNYHGKWTAADTLQGLMHKKLAKVLLKSLGSDAGMSIRKWTVQDIRQIIRQLKGWRLEIKRVQGFEKAQVTTGGVLTGQVDPKTMEAIKYPGLYITGEMLDVDGICGGYNLQWAWTSGYLAGRAAGNG